MSATHPTNAPNAQSQAQYAVRIGELITLMRGDRPPEGDARRAVYDEAIRVLGEGNGRDGAVAYLVRSHIAAIRRTHELAQGGGTLGDQAQPLERTLVPIDAGIGQGEAQYSSYETIGTEIAALIRTSRGGALAQAPRAEDQAATRQSLPLIETQLRDMGPIHLLSSSANESLVAVNASSTPALNSMFGGESNAVGAMTSLGNAYATLTNHPNDIAAQTAAAQALHQSLSQIPSNKEIWNSSVHPHFAAAMAALSRGDLRTGLAELSQEPALNAVYGQLNNLYVISVNQRAIAVMRAGVTVRYEFDRNMEAFTEFLRGSREGEFQPRVLWLALGLHYEYLLMSGQLRQFEVTPGAAGEAGGVRQVGSRRLEGTGHVIGVTPQIGIGASAWGNPMEIVLHANVGYRAWEIGADVADQTGTTQRVQVGDQGAYLGVTGVEVRFPGREGQRAPVRMSRIGAGIVGAPTNVYANISFEGNWLEGNTMRIRSEITPQYSYFLEQHRVGAELRPADFTWQINPNWSLFFGPGFRYDYNITGGTHTLDGFGAFGFRFDRGVSVDIRGGYLGEVGGPEEQRIPASPYGSLNITITPGAWFKGGEGEKRISGEAVPRKRRER